MGIKQSFEYAKSLPPESLKRFVDEALKEPYEEIQRTALEFIVENADLGFEDIILSNFLSLPQQLRQEVLKNKFSLMPFAKRVIRTGSEQEKLSAYNFLAQTGEVEAIILLFNGLADASENIVEFSSKAIDKIAEEFYTHLRLANRKADPKSKDFVEERQALMHDILEYSFSNFPAHRKSIFIDIAIEMGGLCYDLIFSALLKDREGPLYRALMLSLSTTVSKSSIEILFKLYKERIIEFQEIVEKVLTYNISIDTLSAISDYLMEINKQEIGEIAKPFKKIFWAKLLQSHAERLEPQKALLHMEFLRQSSVPLSEQYSMITCFLSHPSEAIRCNALKILLQMDYPKILEIATKMVNDQSDEVVITCVSLIDEANPPSKLNILVPLLSHKSPRVQDFVRKKVFAVLVNKYFQTFEQLDEDARKTAAKVIAKIDESIVQRIGDDITSLEPSKRIRALKIIEYAGLGQDLSKEIMELLKDPDVAVRATAIKLASLYGGREVMQTLIDALNSPDRRIRANAIEAFSATGDARFISLIEPFLSDPDNRVRANAALAFFRLGREEGFDVLVRMLNDPVNEKMRLSAAWALGEVKGQRAKDALVNRLRVESAPSIKAKILESLAKV